MTRTTGVYHTSDGGGEKVRAFIPNPLPPTNPVLRIEGELADQHNAALAAIGRLDIASDMVPSPEWFLYGFVRKEAVVSSQIEGTQSTLEDVLAFELSSQAHDVADVEEVCNYVEALNYARAELANEGGLPLCTRLICEVHKRLMQGVRGGEKQPGTIRTSQNWIGGTRPGNAKFVPPPPDAVPELLAGLDKWIHSDDQLPPLVKAGLAHVQFETIHPFLDGNGRVGRLLVTLLTEHWNLLSGPYLYVSLGFKRHRQEYYQRLGAVRADGDWEGWTDFFLRCVHESAVDGANAAQRLFRLVNDDRRALTNLKSVNVSALRLFELLPEQPMVTAAKALEMIGSTKPTTNKAIVALVEAGILEETTGKQRDRIYAYRKYLNVLAEDTGSSFD
jgi:Fic family protein